MPPSKPIPTPIRVRWRDFRVRFLPLLVFLLSMAAAATLWNRIHLRGEEPESGFSRAPHAHAEVAPDVAGMTVESRVCRFETLR